MNTNLSTHSLFFSLVFPIAEETGRAPVSDSIQCFKVGLEKEFYIKLAVVHRRTVVKPLGVLFESNWL